MNPKATIEAVLAGDHAQFADLVRHYDGPVRRIVRRSLTDPQALEEVIQEVWYRTFEKLAALTDSAKIEPWLGRIARNCVTDHFRERRRLARFEPLVDETPRPARIEWVWELVDRLEPSLREVLTWRYREHHSYAEIAQRLGVPPSTVRGRLFQARTALKRRIEDARPGT